MTKSTHPGWSKIDTSMARPLSADQKMRPMLEVLAELKELYGRDPDPVRTLLIMSMGYDPAPSAPMDTFVPQNVQLEAAKTVARYVRPQLQNVQVTGVDEGPVKIDATMAAQVGMDADLLKLAEDFAIKLAGADTNSPDSGEKEG